MGMDDKLEFGKHYLILNQKLENHIKAHNNPHKVIPADLGLDKIQNFDIAKDATTGQPIVADDDEKYVTSGAVYRALQGDLFIK